MLNKSIRILNFDDSLIKQKRILLRYPAQIIDLEKIGPKVRLWMNSALKDEIAARLLPETENAVTFTGSGDFHHISGILTRQFREPFSLIVFDHHPDWDILPPRYGCGSWVTEALRNKALSKCLLIGVSSSDISTWSIQSGNFVSLKASRLEIYPYLHEPTRVFLEKIPENNSFRREGNFLLSKIFWSELKDKNIPELFLSLVRSLPVKNAYVSLDKDCLKNEDSLTNWEEGKFSLDELLVMLKIIKDNCEIIGMDICGDYSKPSFANKFKAVISRLDHPRNIAAEKLPESMVTSINETTNLRILEVLI
ncbi:MAG: hypothetical protein ABSE81_02325 [Candidatus Omnitrophota bacterium]|jgi:hypothetical protein